MYENKPDFHGDSLEVMPTSTSDCLVVNKNYIYSNH